MARTETRLEKRIRWQSLQAAPPAAGVLRASVLASFTAAPLEPYLGTALHDLGLPADVRVGPYNQLVGECLDDAGETARRRPEILVVWPQLETLWAGRGAPLSEQPRLYVRDLEEVASAAAGAARRWGATLVFVLPAIPAARPLGLGDAGNRRGVHACAASAREAARRTLAGRPEALVLDFEEVVRRIGLEAAWDARLEHLAHVPYSELAFEEVGLRAARLVSLRRSGPKRVLVVVPEGLLWEGQAAAGAAGLVIGEERRAFQVHLRELKRAGVALALWGGGQPVALAEAFARPEMRLAREDVELWDGAGAKGLARALERAGVAPREAVLLRTAAGDGEDLARALPGLKVLELPEEAETWVRLLEDEGGLDRFGPAEPAAPEDAPDPAARAPASVAEFVAGLNVVTRIAAADAGSIPGIVHVTETTKDFNLTGKVHAEAELSEAARSPGRAWTIHVEDRFGDYGNAGAILARAAGDRLEVDGWWLNCRVLGKRVELRSLEWLAAEARRRGCRAVHFEAVRTDRNEITMELLERFAAPTSGGGLEVEVQRLEEWIQGEEGRAGTPAPRTLPAPSSRQAEGGLKVRSLAEFIARRWSRYPASVRKAWFDRLDAFRSGEEVLAAIEQAGLKARREQDVPFVAPRTETEKKVARIFAEKLKVETVGVLDNFFLSGGHSILATQLIFELHRAFQVDLPVRVFFENPTVALISQTIDAIRKAGSAEGIDEVATSTFRYLTAVSLPKEVVLEAAIDARSLPPYQWAAPRRILLTGATGFLGPFLLGDLLASTSADILCLVRAQGEEEGMARIRESLRRYGVEPGERMSRIHALAGDLALPLLGLPEAAFAELAETCDAIVHAGAVTNFIDPYPRLKATNVGGTHEVLRLAATRRLKPVHFTSTLYVFSPINHAEEERVGEDQMPKPGEVLHMGYTQSKWVAEHLIRTARERGIPCTVYRCGRISGHTRTGACQSNDFIWRMIRASIELGLAFDREMSIDMVPVDHVSRSIAHLVGRPDSIGRVFHLQGANFMSMDQLVGWMKGCGYQIGRLPYAEFRERLVEHTQRSQEGAAAAVLAFFPQRVSEWRIHVSFDDRRTRAALEGAGFTCPEIDEPLFQRYVRWFAETGFLPQPGTAPRRAGMA